MQTPAPQSSQKSNVMRNIVVIIVILVIVSGVGYYLYEASQQPNIQATNLQVGTAVTNPQTTTVQNQGRVSNSGSFSYSPPVNLEVYLVFDNSFSIISSKSVSLSYSVSGSSNSKSFSVGAGQISTIQVPINGGQTISGTFSVSGGSGNDIDFSVQQYTCSQTVPFSVTLVNSGKASGYVVLTLHTETGAQVFSNKYYVTLGQQLPISGQANIGDCASHTLSSTISQQQKG